MELGNELAIFFMLVVLGLGVIVRAAISNPGATAKGGFEIWKFFNK